MKLYTEEQVRTMLDLSKLNVYGTKIYSKDELIGEMVEDGMSHGEEYYNQTYKQTNGIEDDEIKFIKKQLENIEHYKRGYNAAQTNLYTEKQLTQAMLEMCEYIIDAFERRILIDTNEKAKYIIKSLKLKK